MIRFVPTWTTPTGSLRSQPIPQGGSVSLALLADDTASFYLPNTPILSVVLSAQGELSGVWLNGVLISQSNYTVEGVKVTIRNSFQITGDQINVVIKRKAPLAFSFISGALPPGLSISTAGVISGQVTATTTTSFTFTIRISNGKAVRDRTFTLAVEPKDATKTIIRNSLPAIRTDTDLQIQYYSFGAFARAEAVIETLEVTGDAELVVVPMSGSGFINRIPDGVALTDNSIRGTIAPNCQSGRYLFRLALRGEPDTALNSFVCEINVLDRLAAFVEKPLIINWQTPEGDLGSVTEGYPVNFVLSARHSGGAVSYGIAPSSKALPTGMRVNPMSGYIEGKAPHVSRDTTFAFTVRAARSGNFVDRRFSFTVQNRYTTSDVLDVRLKLRSTDQTPMVDRYRTVIDPAVLYRSSDPSFGMPSEPFIYFIKGVSAKAFDQAINGTSGDAITKATDYHGPLELVLGEHKSAIVRDASGTAIYEVLYRELYDPLAKAGGFLFDTTTASEQKVRHAQTGKTVYITSVRNGRLDLVKDCGFPTTDPTAQYRVGLGSAESLPEWMTSPQTSDSGSALGFIPAIMLANVTLGTGAPLARLLNRDTVLPPRGRQVILDRYYLYSISYGTPTTFDGNTTTFGTIVFDFEVLGDETSVQI